jgi:hypothetical protein
LNSYFSAINTDPLLNNNIAVTVLEEGGKGLTGCKKCVLPHSQNSGLVEQAFFFCGERKEKVYSADLAKSDCELAATGQRREHQQRFMQLKILLC